MKYWNKSKKTRLAHWTAVERPIKWWRGANGTWVAFPEAQRIEEMKYWCQMQSSTGRFYFKERETTWWFERSKDATWFLLYWASKE